MYNLLANLAGDGPDWTSCVLSGIWNPDGHREAALEEQPDFSSTPSDEQQCRRLTSITPPRSLRISRGHNR